jgi:hypothetical protein
MASLTITDPASNSTVAQTFDCDGTFSTTGLGHSLEDTCGQVVATLYDSSDNVIQVRTYPIAGRTPPPSGNWSVTFSVSQGYTGCTIIAELQLNGTTPPYPLYQVNNITISS